ncbi:MAG TPA: protein phosphatase 2C domain-containing protein [Isosphaeraceae bacterium]|nr:protein phosphatase 2C domain-containing protein [Isosphaeraceae bacterium]
MNWDDLIIDAAATDTGMRRSNNQDSFIIVRASTPESWRQRGHLFMVADGMGAHAVGELASKMACDNIPHTYNKAKNSSASEAITKAYQNVSAQIHGRAAANRDFQGMGTTSSALILIPEGALIAHVGDSRVYRMRGGRIDQLSFDHSLVWELVRRNHLTPEQAQKAVPKNVITRSLGPDPNVEVDLEGPFAVEPGDVFLLCSDGLSGPVSDLELGAFSSNFHPEDACRYVLHLANLRGGYDNITVLIVRVGPWVDPNAAADTPEPVPVGARAGHRGEERKRAKSGRLASFISGLNRRPPAPTVVEDHPYRSAECRIEEPLIESLTTLVRGAQASAIEHAWPLDWAMLANLRREGEEARTAGDLRASLRCLGEAIVLLGLAGRLHRKANGTADHL